MTLSVDYHPDDILSRIIQKTGISTNCFSPKTIMWISKEKVSVRSRFQGDEGQKGLEEFIKDIQEEIASKEIRKVEQEEK